LICHNQVLKINKEVIHTDNYVVSHLKDMNRLKVYNLLLKHQEGIYRNEIARLTGISAPTVLKIIDFMMEKGLINEIGSGQVSVGRKPNMLELNKNRFYSIGIEYEGEFMSIGIVNLLGEIIHFLQVRCNKNFENTLYANIDKLLKISNINSESILGIGIGIPGIYNPQTQEIFAPLIGYENKQFIGDVIDRIKTKYNMFVAVDNDVNMEAMGEFHSLKLEEGDDLLHVSIGTGVGCGIILDGKIRRGSHYMAGEIGYMAFDKPTKGKEIGWLEDRINLSVLEHKFHINPESINDNRHTKEEAIEYIAGYISLCINNIITCIDVSNITLGGIVTEMFDSELIDRINQKLKEICVLDVKVKKQVSPLPGVIGASVLINNIIMPEILSENI
jgi:predicted NBD/HSP70 family sugar kinase